MNTAARHCCHPITVVIRQVRSAAGFHIPSFFVLYVKSLTGVAFAEQLHSHDGKDENNDAQHEGKVS